MDRYLVISSDGHVGLPPERYRDYLEAKYHQQFDETVQLEIKAREEHEKRFLIDDFNTKWRARVGDGLEGAWDGTIRNRVLNQDGVATLSSRGRASSPRCCSPTGSPNATRRPSAPTSG